GLKAYRHADGSVWTFRPDRNADRMNASAARMALPTMDGQDFVESLRALVEQDAAWVPTPQDDADEVSLYLRPFMISAERFLGLRPTQQADYYVIASPAAAYFSGGVKPVSIWLSQNLKRAGKGGTGFAKCGGNYAASTEAMIEAAGKGCQQVLFTDAVDGTHLEELGGMNIMLVTSDGKLLTPPVSETILDGVTRRSIIDLAPQLGLTPEERPITVDEWRAGVADGTIVEAFACGTAAAVTPIGRVRRPWPCAGPCWTSSTAAPRPRPAGWCSWRERLRRPDPGDPDEGSGSDERRTPALRHVRRRGSGSAPLRLSDLR